MNILKFLDDNNIEYRKFDHQPVFTIEDCKELQGAGAATKNMFLRDKKGKRHIFLAVPENKQVDLKALTKELHIYLYLKMGCVSS
ncbi:MAG: YbaK/EbsC family protein [Bdellovibrionota bacterium]